MVSLSSNFNGCLAAFQWRNEKIPEFKSKIWIFLKPKYLKQWQQNRLEKVRGDNGLCTLILFGLDPSYWKLFSNVFNGRYFSHYWLAIEIPFHKPLNLESSDGWEL